LLPNDYCGDVNVRLSLYKRLASTSKAEQIDAMLEETVDRFGTLPSQGQVLFDTHRLRVLAQPFGVARIDAAPGVINILFKPNPPIEAIRVIQLVQKNPSIKLVGNEKLRIDKSLKDPADRAQCVREVLKLIGPPKKA
jgi:transcription-repair coupling factor (superfamily II helicase)